MRLKQAILWVLMMAVAPVAFGQRTISENQKQKFDEVIRYIETKYVDTADFDNLIEKAIVGLVAELDPHSEYMTTEEFRRMEEPLQGNFEGIGVQFNILKDTITVVSPISGGPSEKLGIRSGDRIVEIEDTTVAGIGIKNEDVIKKLRGDRGTKVRVKILRRGVSEPIEYTIVRDKIPIFSVDAGYMLNEEVGYIKINRFAQSTLDEFNTAMDKLEPKGLKHLVIDLRGNSGGYLHASIALADEFLDNDALIVYTEGLNAMRSDKIATPRGRFHKGKLVVLIDEGSASASEIVSGAIQDHDRGLIIGRRSFGKGLVQFPFKLNDGSRLKLTTARYHTPSGRCIQRPYEAGQDEYRKENRRREAHGELYTADSIHFDENEKYFTNNKRVVYGGGGIMPDIFIPVDTSENSKYLRDLLTKGTLFTLVSEYVDANRDQLKAEYPQFEDFEAKFQVEGPFLDAFLAQAEKDSVEFDAEGMAISGKNIKLRLKARMASSLWGTEEFFRVINRDDPAVKAALEAIQDKTFKKLKLAYN
jgi:carboxyl-terminal processing protease